MAITSQGARGSGVVGASASSTVTHTPGVTVAVGQVLVTYVTMRTTNAVQSIADAVGNAWTFLAGFTNAANGNVRTEVWVCRVTAQLSSATVITCTFASSGNADVCIGSWEYSVAAGQTLAVATASVTSEVNAANGFGSSSFSGLASAARLYLRVGGKQANSTTAITQSTNFTSHGLTARSRNNASATLLRAEHRINTSTGETSNPTFAVSGNTAGLFLALVEATPTTSVNGTAASAAFAAANATTRARVSGATGTAASSALAAVARVAAGGAVGGASWAAAGPGATIRVGGAPSLASWTAFDAEPSVTSSETTANGTAASASYAAAGVIVATLVIGSPAASTFAPNGATPRLIAAGGSAGGAWTAAGAIPAQRVAASSASSAWASPAAVVRAGVATAPAGRSWAASPATSAVRVTGAPASVNLTAAGAQVRGRIASQAAAAVWEALDVPPDGQTVVSGSRAEAAWSGLAAGGVRVSIAAAPASVTCAPATASVAVRAAAAPAAMSFDAFDATTASPPSAETSEASGVPAELVWTAVSAAAWRPRGRAVTTFAPRCRVVLPGDD